MTYSILFILFSIIIMIILMFYLILFIFNLIYIENEFIKLLKINYNFLLFIKKIYLTSWVEGKLLSGNFPWQCRDCIANPG